MSKSYVNYGRLSKYIVTEDDSGPWVDEETGQRYKVVCDSSIWVGGDIEEMPPDPARHLTTYYFNDDNGKRHELVAYE